jgi:hypothetical protein
MGSLWSPETSNEIEFVTSTFPFDYYHLGIEQYVYAKGAYFSDNSYSIGLPFYTGKYLLGFLRGAGENHPTENRRRRTIFIL